MEYLCHHFLYGVLNFLCLVLLVLKGVGAADVLPLYIFGDSTADVGTNNFLPLCQARADVLYNGIDFPSKVPTGRFSNGYNTMDFIAMLMGHKRSPLPFLYLVKEIESSFKTEILLGVNFASGGSGILNHTGKQFIEVIPFSKQIEQFTTVYNNLSEALGAEAAGSFIKKSVILISIGSNDLFEFYDFNSTSGSDSDLFLKELFDQYEIYLRKLLDIGVRKLAVMSVPPIGCVPHMRSRSVSGDCIQDLTLYALTFFQSIQNLLDRVTSEYQGLLYSLGDSFAMTILVIADPKLIGLTDAKTACCGNGTFNGEDQCDMSSKLCPNRSEYLFWDRFHPTQDAANYSARNLYTGPPAFASPINLEALVAAGNA